MFTILKCLVITLTSYVLNISANPELPIVRPISEQTESLAFFQVCYDDEFPIIYGAVNVK